MITFQNQTILNGHCTSPNEMYISKLKICYQILLATVVADISPDEHLLDEPIHITQSKWYQKLLMKQCLCYISFIILKGLYTLQQMANIWIILQACFCNYKIDLYLVYLMYIRHHITNITFADSINVLQPLQAITTSKHLHALPPKPVQALQPFSQWVHWQYFVCLY